MPQIVKTNKLYPKSRRLRTTTALTGPKKGSEPPGIDTEIKGGSKRSSYRKR
jgi:hypothetical protein